MKSVNNSILLICIIICVCCNKENNPQPPAPTPNNITLNGRPFNSMLLNTSLLPEIQISFTQPIKSSSLSAVILTDNNGKTIAANISLSHGDSVVFIQPTGNLSFLTKYYLVINTALQSSSGGYLQTAINGSFVTKLDSSRKFPIITDDALLDTVQKRTLKYFWDFAHPVSGLARERNTSGDVVTTGGSGFGIMALITAAARNFIPKTEVLTRLKKIVYFLKNTAQTFHGAYPHWLNGATGTVVPFSANDNGADLVETSYLVEGLLCARQYFNGGFAEETDLRTDINSIIDRVEWNWFQQNNQNVLYWHWSPDKAWSMNVTIQGWNECLITYVLAAASKNYSIPKPVYDNGWARNGAIKNGNQYYSYILPLGPPVGGPLFFEHYSFLGINPKGLMDAYANYEIQTKNHTLINYNYCIDNPNNYYGYSDSVWGLTASDIKGGYTASAPTNDKGFIAPTAAISSIPYTPNESMAALRFFYYVLGDKLFKEYGFRDAFSLNEVKEGDAWFADSYLAIDEGPIIIMIENYRSQLLWNLFMSCPEIKAALKKLEFTSPYI